MPFADVIDCIIKLHRSHITERNKGDLTRLDFNVEVADSKTKFQPVDTIAALADNLTEVADFRVMLRETLLTGDKRLPVAENRFMLRVQDMSFHCECFVAKDGKQGNMDAMDFKNLINGACT